MQSNLPKIAAYVAGGLLLTSLMRRRHSAAYEIEADLDEAAAHLPWATITMATLGFVAGGVFLSSQMRNRSGARGVSTVEESIELEVPVSTAYNQWTQFEEFPRFMASVENVKQLDDTHLHWRAVVGGKVKEWDAEITEQIPDERIAWRSVDGVTNAGVVTFHKIGDNRTRVMLQMDYQPETFTEKVGDALGGVKLTAKGNLKRFKQLVESRGQETGAWRGTVTQH